MSLNDAVLSLTFAENDFKVAKHLSENFYPMQYEIICYHCQQTAWGGSHRRNKLIFHRPGRIILSGLFLH